MPDTFTPEQISQILEEFFKVVGTRQYIGARYVPIFGRKGEDSIEWDNTAPYEPLTIVLYQGNSYTSRQYVPVGMEITNQEFWAITGNYNAQIEQYRRETAAAQASADNAQAAADAAQHDIDTLLPKNDFSAENTVKKYIDQTENTVKKYIDQNKTRVLSFDTVNELQNASYLESGMVCHTNGFHTIGDGGAAYYMVSASGTANGMDVLALQGGLFATLVVTEPYVTPEQFGAWGDGTHDDTAILQACVNAHKAVHLTKKYKVQGQLNIPANVKLTGNAVYGKTSSEYSLLLMSNDSTINVSTKVAINGLTFLYDREPTDGLKPTCIAASGADWCKFDNINILMAGVGISVSNSRGVNFNYIYGYCTDTMIRTDHVYEITYINYVTCTPHAIDDYASDIEAVIRYSYYNSVCLELGERTDWCEANNVFGFSLLHTLSTDITGGMFSNLGADACKQGIRIGRSATSTPQVTINNLSVTTALSGALKDITYDNDPLVLIDNETANNYQEIMVEINGMQVWGNPYRIISCNRNYACLNVNNLNVWQNYGAPQFSNKSAYDPLDYVVYSYGTNYINVSNVNIRCAGLTTLIGGKLVADTHVSNVIVRTIKQPSNPLITNSDDTVRLYCNNISYIIDSDFVQPETAFDPFVRGASSALRAFGVRFNGISMSKIAVDTTIASNSVYALVNSTIYKQGITE